MHHLWSVLESFFRGKVAEGDVILVAFSGGPDSSVLLWGLAKVSSRLGVCVHAAHFDHGLDPGSGSRAALASEIAAQLGVAITVERCGDGAEPGMPRRGREAEARQRRYDFLERQAKRLRARWIATGHHAEDQAETVLLRMLFGSGLEGLAGIPSQHGRVVRPLLTMRRAELDEALAVSGLEPAIDATNFDLRVPRNLIRHRLLPDLAAEDPILSARLCRLAASAGQAGEHVAARLCRHLRLRQKDAAIALDRSRFEALDAVLMPFALALAHRLAGIPYPASARARRELLRQLRAKGRSVGCDCGRFWRWEADQKSLRLIKSASTVGDFTYTLVVPGEIEIPELSLRFRLREAPVAPWMFRASADRAALALPLDVGNRVEIRNRRPGDRFQPLGFRRARRLKKVFIDRRVPRAARSLLPLLVVEGEIAWVPGYTISDRFRVRGQSSAWVAEIVGNGGV